MEKWGKILVERQKFTLLLLKLAIRLSRDTLITTSLITQAFDIVCCRGLEGWP
jgi:hypothetical protein